MANKSIESYDKWFYEHFGKQYEGKTAEEMNKLLEDAKKAQKLAEDAYEASPVRKAEIEAEKKASKVKDATKRQMILDAARAKKWNKKEYKAYLELTANKKRTNDHVFVLEKVIKYREEHPQKTQGNNMVMQKARDGR